MQPLSLVLAQAIRKMNIAKPFAMHSLIGHWRQLVGDDIADAFLTKTISASALAQKMTQWLQLSEVQKQEWRVLSMLRSRVFDSQIQAAQWTRLFEKYA